MTTAKIRVQHSQAVNIAQWILDRAVSTSRLPCVVSDPCVITELLILAKERGITVEFYAVGDVGGQVRLDMVGVKRVLEGGRVRKDE